ncbi:MAG: sugar phosphate nucleotidyltransferase [Bacteroidota bacterium]|nr:sugar phosphate nucleotidyltransferase [Bacteroidota bacterium]
MKIIVPMAGRGSRLRPHTLTIPKPLIPIAGKPIVQRLVEDISNVCNEKVDEIAFIIGDFGKEVETNLISIAESLGAKGSIYFQEEALGTAHAILCAKESLKGNIVVAFADTLFKADFKLDNSSDGIIWVKQIENPSAFGVVKLNSTGEITDFVEKPDTYVSNLAIIGIYYFKSGEQLCNELEYLIDNDIKEKDEYQLTDALENMKNKGVVFRPGEVKEWLDCGNKNVTVATNKKVLELNNEYLENNTSASLTNSIVIPPCYIGDNVELTSSVIGPYVSIGDNTKITNCVINNSLIQENSTIKSAVLSNSMIGNNTSYIGKEIDLSIGDFTEIKV